MEPFLSHGKFCTKKPCEVLLSIMGIIISIIYFIDYSQETSDKNIHPEYSAIDILFMTIIRGGAIFYTYRQFQSLNSYGSIYLWYLGISFIVYSCMFFSCIVIKLLDSNISNLKEATFIFLLFVDLNKVGFLSQYAIEASCYKEVQTNIAEGVSLLGPSLTLNTMVEILILGAGTLSGVDRVEQICRLAVLSIIVNYIFLMTFHPCSLSLLLEWPYKRSPIELPCQPMKNRKSPTKSIPVLPRVQVMLLSGGLFLIYGLRRWVINPEAQNSLLFSESKKIPFEFPIDAKCLNCCLDQVSIFILFVVLSKCSRSHQNRHILSNQSLKDSSPPKNQLNQTEEFMFSSDQESLSGDESRRSTEECRNIWKSRENCGRDLSKAEILNLLRCNKMNHRDLEKKMGGNFTRAIDLRRRYICARRKDESALDDLRFKNYDYDKVQGVCCENVFGYMQIPVGCAGPLTINDEDYYVPMCTTEGALVASVSRGCKAISLGSGVLAHCFLDAMTRAPLVKLSSVRRAVQVMDWIKEDHGRNSDSILTEAFNSTSNYARCTNIFPKLIGRRLYIRFSAQTGDAMGMNMVGKGVEAALEALKRHFPDLEVVCLSGNFCTDKKHSAVNNILGRGKSVTCEAIISSDVVRAVLKTTTAKLVSLNIDKNLIGSSVAGSIGGNNAQAANVVAAIFIACGQDPAQVIESSQCTTIMEKSDEEGGLLVSVTMPSIEVGTVGGGTILPSQSACLRLLGVKGASPADEPGKNAKQLSLIVASTVLAGELSLLSSLAEHTLMKSHLALNRSSPPTT